MYVQPNLKISELSKPLSVKDAIADMKRCTDKFGYGVHCVTDYMQEEKDYLPGFCDVHTHGLNKFCGHEIRLVRYFQELNETPVVLINIINTLGSCIVKYYDENTGKSDAFYNIFDQKTHDVYLPPEIPDGTWTKIGSWETDIDEENVIRIIRETDLLQTSEAMQRLPLQMHKVAKGDSNG